MIKKLQSSLTYRNFLWVNFFFVALKVLYIVFFQKEFLAYEDFTIAKNIVSYHQYSEFIDQGGTAFKLPVYPICISVFLWLFGNDDGLMVLAVFHALLSFFSPLFLYKILKLFGLEQVGILAGFFFILSPAYFLYPTIIEASNVFVPILLLWFYFYFRLWLSTDSSVKSYIIFGVITAILFLTQVVIVPLAVIMVSALLIFKRTSWGKFSILICTTLLLYSPWIIRNYFVFDQLVLSKTPTWQNIYFGFTPNGQLLEDMKLISKERDHELYQMRDEKSELTMEKIYKNEVKKVTSFKPYYFIKKAAGSFVSLWYVPPKYFDDNSLSTLFGRKIYVISLNILTLISLIFVYKRSKILFYLSLLFFANFTFPYLIGHAVNMRFKLDFEWYQLILVAFLIIELADRRGDKQEIASSI